MKDIRLSDDVSKKNRGNEIGVVNDIRGGNLVVYWLATEQTTTEIPDDLEIYTYGPHWTQKEAKAEAKARGLKLRIEKGSSYKTITL